VLVEGVKTGGFEIPLGMALATLGGFSVTIDFSNNRSCGRSELRTFLEGSPPVQHSHRRFRGSRLP
jgi:hypothetical protein